MGKDNDRWMRIKVAGMTAVFDLASSKATFTKKEAAAAYCGLNQKQQEQVKDAVREAVGYDASTAAGGDDDNPMSILNELGKREQDPGIEFVEWLLREEQRETKIEETPTPTKPGLRKLGDKTPAAPAKRVLGNKKPEPTGNGNDPKTGLTKLLEGVTGPKKSTAKNLLAALNGGGKVEDVRRRAVMFKVVTEDELKKAGV
jgi:hypothetical protein